MAAPQARSSLSCPPWSRPRVARVQAHAKSAPMHLRIHHLGLLCCISFFTGCGSSGDDTSTDETTPPDPTYASINAKVFQPTCAVSNCHGKGGNDETELDLSGTKAYAAMVNVKSEQVTTMDLVKPGDPENSYLWHKINGTSGALGGDDAQMPDERPALDAETQAAIKTWIANGAQK